jgi:hypothetical protein
MACLLRDGFQGNLDAFGEETIMSTPIPVGREAAEAAQGRGKAGNPAKARVCVVGASGKLGRYMVQHTLDRGYEVIAVWDRAFRWCAAPDQLQAAAGPLRVSWASNVEVMWEHPSTAHYLDRLGQFARIIRFDKRGPLALQQIGRDHHS